MVESRCKEIDLWDIIPMGNLSEDPVIESPLCASVEFPRGYVHFDVQNSW